MVFLNAKGWHNQAFTEWQNIFSLAPRPFAPSPHSCTPFQMLPTGLEKEEAKDEDALSGSVRGVGVMMWSPSWKLQLLDTCKDATSLHCVTDEATHLALTDQVSHRLQCTVEWVGLVPPR